MFGSRPLDKTQHSSRSWRIHQIAKDFRLLDVWAMPTPGGPDDFGELVRLMATFDPGETSPAVRALFAIRWTIGRALGLDRQETGLGTRVHSLRDRLPADLADTPSDFDTHLFTPLYVTDNVYPYGTQSRDSYGHLCISELLAQRTLNQGLRPLEGQTCNHNSSSFG